MNKIAENIKYFRELHHLTQQELAEKLNIARTSVTKWENSTQLPDLISLIKLSELFDVSIDTLVGRALTQQDVLLEFQKVYSIDDPLLNQKTLNLIDYLNKHEVLQNLLVELAELSPKKRKPIEEIMTVVIREIIDLYS